MARGNVGFCVVSLHDFCPVVMDVLLVCTFGAGSSMEELSTGRLVAAVSLRFRWNWVNAEM